jgi:molybdate transport system regulatory protein
MRYAKAMAKSTNAELWIKLSLPGVGQVGPGKMDLLRQVDEHESIAAAARAMNMSYRRAWLLIDEMNKLFEEPVVAKWQGGKSKGGASLTEFGQSLLEKYAVLVENSNEVNREILDEIGQRVNRAEALKRA